MNLEGHVQMGYNSKTQKKYGDLIKVKAAQVPQLKRPVIKQIEGPPKATAATKVEEAQKPVVISTKTEVKEDEKAEGEVAL